MPLFRTLMGAPVVRFLAERVTNWRVWDDVSPSSMLCHYPYEINANPTPQKARRQILLTKLRPSDEAKTRSETTVLDHLIHSDLKESDLGPQGFPRLAQLIQQAGAHNVSFSLTTIITYLLLDSEKEAILRKELEDVFHGSNHTDDGGPSWRDLEKCVYLSACIKEGLRYVFPVVHRLSLY